jgi:hypothetical protein
MALSVLFLAAASPKVGAGHDSRTALVAEACRRSGMTVGRSVLDPDDPVATSAASTLALEGAWDAYVLDGPDAFLDSWLPRLPTEALRVAFRMHGPGRRGLEDVAVTPSPGATREELAGERLLARGRDFLFVRPSLFAGADGERGGVLVTMGGADPNDATTLACEALKPLAGELPVTVVVGALNPRFEDVASRFGHGMRVLRQGEVDFDEELKRAAVAVINGGLTRYECVAARTPFVALSLDEGQAAYTEAVVASGFGRHAGLLSSTSPRTILVAVEELLVQPAKRLEMAARATDLVRPDAADLFARTLVRWYTSIAPRRRP